LAWLYCRDDAQRYSFGVGKLSSDEARRTSRHHQARWICEQAHQQLKEKLGLDHFEGRSWQGLHRHALMTMIAYAFLQHRHLTQVGRKKESTDRRLSLACRPYATPSSISSSTTISAMPTLPKTKPSKTVAWVNLPKRAWTH
jgi:SRSO17 transposase